MTTEIKLASRLAALFIAEATPKSASGTAFMTAVVSGATTIAMPIAIEAGSVPVELPSHRFEGAERQEDRGKCDDHRAEG